MFFSLAFTRAVKKFNIVPSVESDLTRLAHHMNFYNKTCDYNYYGAKYGQHKGLLMTLIEKDFSKFLVEIGYSKSTAKNYPCYLRKFATENGYETIIDLADDVFTLLDKGAHEKRDLSKKTLSAVKRYKSVLILFNSFLFDVGFKRKFIIHRPSSMNYMEVLTTDKKHIPGVQPRTLVDIDKHTGQKTDKQWFSITEVADALHVGKDVLTRWDNFSEEKKRKNCIPHRYKGETVEGIDLTWNMNKSERFNYSYYILKELNDFLEYQFDYGTGTKREQYLSDVDIRKNSKKD